MAITATSTNTFHMVHLQLDAKGLAALGRMLNLPAKHTTTNYLVHCALGELFGDDAPKPFSIESTPGARHVHVLGYADVDADGLQNQAQIGASPTVYDLCDWEALAVKDMPTALPEGLALRFEVRACPVIRKASAGSGTNAAGDTVHWREGQELDAFLSEQWTSDVPLSREQVYADWLTRQFDVRGGADITAAGLERFSIERMMRRVPNGTKRKAAVIKRPDVTFTGTLQVTDSDAFLQVLRSGLGRHKTFGYGMLKIRRA
ncbi:type I-E CRISPR-associated protein Cas6/Cse3/CasE [Salisaeta longa]|uniref:type I-E CRISPR-associated protein Cas6/Cse3/CasE n=1 Tax=Salisaeta longa TaxID=503170 RepID=UPI0003B3B70B|nr:type I-E CRISPR-associated protein Cas6/Cse3/CasE [Salisaeta longa]